MSTFPKQNESSRGGRRRTLAAAAIVMIALANNFHGVSAVAAVRLPDEAISEPWLLPSNDIPAVVDSVAIQPLAPPADTQRHTIAARSLPDRSRRQSTRREKRALVELFGLVASPSEEQSLIKSFEKLSTCREFVAINC
jgi:hypothetical protein